MNLKDEDVVSAVALVVDSGEAEEIQGTQEGLPLDGATSAESQGPQPDGSEPSV